MRDLFAKEYVIDGIDLNGKKFDRVSRLEASSGDSACIIDFNDEIFPLTPKEKIRLTIAQGHYSEEAFGPYDYVMSGIYYKCAEEKDKLNSYISCGGLLVCVEEQLNADVGGDVYVCLQRLQV
eukprot:NODE_649_length_5558_cov_0.180253.p2 type:complete len:123 gc:universal NODE_649_length_5558_cov_0.180253:1916-2284(+)